MDPAKLGNMLVAKPSYDPAPAGVGKASSMLVSMFSPTEKTLMGAERLKVVAGL
jgi:hypothetical protein